MDDVKTMLKVSNKLEKAFKQINFICARFLSNKEEALQNGTQNPILSSRNNSMELSVRNEQQNQKRISNSKKNQQKNVKISRYNNGGYDSSLPEKPKQPLTPYFLFLTEKRQTIKKQYPSLSPNDMSTVMGQVWNSLSSEEKKPFETKHNRKKIQYERKMKIYNEACQGKKMQKLDKQQFKKRQRQILFPQI